MASYSWFLTPIGFGAMAFTAHSHVTYSLLMLVTVVQLFKVQRPVTKCFIIVITPVLHHIVQRWPDEKHWLTKNMLTG